MINYFDLGLHTGIELYWMANEILPEIGVPYRCYGIEACKAYVDKLRQFYLFDDHVHIRHLAIANYEGWTDLYHHPNQEGHSIFATKRGVSSDTERVPCTRFSYWLQHTLPMFHQDINILKFNIEGAELHLVRDLIECNLFQHFPIVCGANTDVEKVEEIKHYAAEHHAVVDANTRFFAFHEYVPYSKRTMKKRIAEVMQT